MRRLITFSLQKRSLVLLLFVTFLGAGAYGFNQLNIEAYPDPVPPTVVIITQNSGQSAEEIERYITVPIRSGWRGCRTCAPSAPPPCSGSPSCRRSSPTPSTTTSPSSRC